MNNKASWTVFYPTYLYGTESYANRTFTCMLKAMRFARKVGGNLEFNKPAHFNKVC